MKLYSNLFFLIYNLILKTPSRDEYPYLLTVITLSGLLSFNFVLILDFFILRDVKGKLILPLVLILYIFISILNYLIYYKKFKNDNKKQITMYSSEFGLLVLLLLIPFAIIVLKKNGF